MVCPADLSALAADLPERETAAGAVRPDEVLDLRVAVPDPAAGIAEEEADSVLVDVRAPGYSLFLRYESTPLCSGKRRV